MARKEKKQKEEEGSTWLITFSDMMTLMLTFFVLLVSMSVIDERRKLVVLGSILGTFGIGQQGFDPRSVDNRRLTMEPGPLELDSADDLEPLKDMLWEDFEDDIDFQHNKYVEILSINDDVLFEPGSTHLSTKGKHVLDRMLPALLDIDFPLLLAGHTSIRREEEANYDIALSDDSTLDFSWKLSFHRVMSMYKYLLSRGMDPEKLFVEAFGRFKPRDSNDTPEGRRANRRVDIVLDRRNEHRISMLRKYGRGEKDDGNVFIYKDFRFNVSRPGDNNQTEVP